MASKPRNTRPDTAADADGRDPAGADSGMSAPASFIDVAWPPPEDIPAELLRFVSVVVTSRGEGRRRAGRDFTRSETVIPVVDLEQADVEALVNDSELNVRARVPIAAT